jgi:hypothetical protein
MIDDEDQFEGRGFLGTNGRQSCHEISPSLEGIGAYDDRRVRGPEGHSWTPFFRPVADPPEWAGKRRPDPTDSNGSRPDHDRQRPADYAICQSAGGRIRRPGPTER